MFDGSVNKSFFLEKPNELEGGKEAIRIQTSEKNYIEAYKKI